MPRSPDHPKIYHITHVDNLPEILRAGVLWSDAKRLELGLSCSVVGMSSIKARRLHELPVKCHPETRVGEYVPFYFCPRSIMLYILHRGNHPELTYRGGQGPIVHLMADLKATVAWADTQGRQWAFSASNAGAYYTDFYVDLGNLDKIDWTAVAASDFRDPLVKEGKQAEFLVMESFPWQLVEEIGVLSPEIEARVRAILRGAPHQPPVRVRRMWYF